MNIRLILCAIALSCLFSSCAGPGFNREWARTLATNPGPHSDVTGLWEGTWESQKNGHTGKLRAIVHETAENRYRFNYWATWGLGMSGTFEIDCEGETNGSLTRVRGSKKLGPFGTYGHDAEITPSKFDATFSSKKENLGTFSLARPE